MSMPKHAARKNKYRAIATVVDGIRFDSKLEAARYQELKLMEKAKLIFNLEIHRRFPLVLRKASPGLIIPDANPGEKVGDYECDASYWEKKADGSQFLVVEDVKGFMTPLAAWKIKHFELQNNIEVRIIKKTRASGARRSA